MASLLRFLHYLYYISIHIMLVPSTRIDVTTLLDLSSETGPNTKVSSSLRNVNSSRIDNIFESRVDQQLPPLPLLKVNQLESDSYKPTLQVFDLISRFRTRERERIGKNRKRKKKEGDGWYNKLGEQTSYGWKPLDGYTPTCTPTRQLRLFRLG